VNAGGYSPKAADTITPAGSSEVARGEWHFEWHRGATRRNSRQTEASGRKSSSGL